jgi:ribosomal protein S18 acetylase RimI-like enzyme
MSGITGLSLPASSRRRRELGAGSVGLHVFGNNDAARVLYEKIGYDTTSIVVSKRLGEG